MVEHVEKQMLQMPMLVVRAEKQMLKVGTWRQMLEEAGEADGEIGNRAAPANRCNHMGRKSDP